MQLAEHESLQSAVGALPEHLAAILMDATASCGLRHAAGLEAHALWRPPNFQGGSCQQILACSPKGHQTALKKGSESVNVTREKASNLPLNIVKAGDVTKCMIVLLEQAI